MSLAAEAPAHVVRRIGGHRLLITGAPPLPAAARAAGLHAWPQGVVPPRDPRRPRRRDRGCRCRGRLCAAARRARGDPARRDRRPGHRPAGQGGGRARRDRRRAHGGSSCTWAPPTRRRTNATRRPRSPRSSGSTRSWSRRSRARSARRTARSPSAPTTAATPLTGAHDDHPGPVPALAGPERARRPADRADGARAGHRWSSARWWSRDRAHRRRRHQLGLGEDDGGVRPHRGAAAHRARRAGLQGRPRLHRPQLPRARLGPARAATSTPSSAARS